ncbi:retrovirus-related pol polyprotein from transposon TNT 1-94 [Tanacetum coccineum]
MARQCPKPKRKRDATWFRDKVLLVEAQGSSKVLNEVALEFLVDLGVAESKTVLMANLSSYGSNVISKVNKDNLIANESLSAELEKYKERVKLLEERKNVDLSTREKLILDDIIREKKAQFADFEKEINYLKQTLSEQSKEKELLTKTFNVFKNESKEKEAKNIDKEIALKKNIKELDNIIRPMLYDGSVIAKENNVISIADSEETLMLAEESRSKMILKQNIVNIVVNSLMDINTSVNVNSSDAMNDSVNYVEMCNKCLELKAKLIKQHDMVEKDEYNKISKRFYELEQHCISLKLAMQINKEIFLKNNTYVNQTKPLFDQLFELNNLNAELQAKDTTIEKLKANIKRKGFCHNSIKNDLRKFKGKDIVYNATQVSNAATIAPGMYKLDLVTLAPKDKNNRETHIYYLKHTMEQAAILREIVEQVISLNPLDSASYSAYKYVKLIQELLGYDRDTCPDIHKPSEKLVAVMPINKKKIVRFAKPVISSSTSQKQLGSSHTQAKQTTNNYVITSIGVSRSTKSSRLKSTDNTKIDRILSMFDARRELCFLEFVSDMNVSSKSKSFKKAKKKEEWKPIGKVFQIVWWYLDSECSKHMPGDRSHLTNFVHKFLGIVKFDNDQIAKIMGYGDYQIGNITILRVYYVEGLGHNLFFVGQFCDSDLEVAFRKHTCFVCNLEGIDLLSGSQKTNLYTLLIGDIMASSPIYLLSKASKTNSWLWHRRLSHLNFGAINHLAKNSLVRGLPKLKIEKDHLCLACAMGKSKKQSHKPKSEDTNQEKLYLLHMDLYEPMRVASINRKKYILIIVDDYSRFTWVKFLASKDEPPNFIIKFLKMIQVRLNPPVRNIRIDNGTKFVNQTLRSYYKSVGISHQTSVVRSPLQNGVVERRNHTLVEAARIIIPDLSYLHVFGALCYPNTDSEDLEKLQTKADIGIFIGYAPKKKAYHICNRRLVANPIPQQPCNPPPRDDWDHLFQPMFDEYFNPPTIVVSLIPVAAAPRAIDLANSPVSKSIDQDAPSTSILSTQEQEYSLIISQGFKESPKMPHFHDDPLHKSLHEDSTSQGSSSNVRPIYTPFESLGRWTKDHPIANVIIDPSRSVSTIKQL